MQGPASWFPRILPWGNAFLPQCQDPSASPLFLFILGRAMLRQRRMVVVNSVRLLGFISYENFQVNMEGGSVWISVGWRITSRGRSGSQARKAEVHQSEPEELSWVLSTILLCFSMVQPRVKRRGDAEGSWRY